MTRALTIGYSPCPNDTYIFYALVHGNVRVPGLEFREQLADVETLNQMALEGSPGHHQDIVPRPRPSA